ncbi:hypothetical protein BC351_01190 [Paenibacillus ferrarius]|uniref:Uncharacterized protein n=1 Tax=Paenibacillus ferrarius TaxID=1469647 RepID=A0A1V4HSP0_9BACL|nr:hypothetical protein [Paenibacillus ferrarius]OPH61886.1 hypothetical protein BC351_01190 [Paenibacillus ferrarius]
MKSVVLHSLINKEYFLGESYTRSMWDEWRSYEITVDYNGEEEGIVVSKETHAAWSIEFETDKFTRELKKGELIHIEGKDYCINKVAHSEDGKILYYLDKKVINEDLASKKKAEQDLETRKLVLADRKKQLVLQEEREENIKSVCGKYAHVKKKWYQIWK